MKCLILEDESAAQKVLQNYIAKTPFLEEFGTYESGVAIPPEKVQDADILFLDIQLPEINGLAYLKTLKNPPQVIVTTAYTNYAIDAFEKAVLDYLMKPFSYERFFKSVMRARTNYLNQKKEIDNSIFLYADKAHYKINLADIAYLKSELDYVKFVTESQEILVLDSLINWAEKLKTQNFFQVHRSYIINLEWVSKVYGNMVYLGDVKIPIGKTYKGDFLNIINK